MESHRSSPGSLSSSQPSCLVSFLLDFPLEIILLHFLLLDRKEKREKKGMFSGKIKSTAQAGAK